MPDADPQTVWRVRDMPRSVRLWYGGQAKLRGLTVAQYLAELKQEKEEQK